jgi:CBS domain containing-hemolysin-like protein
MSLLVVSVLVLLILTNALYVAAEFSAVSVRRSRLQQLAEEGDGLAGRMLPIVMDGAKLDRYIAACQIGITISSLVLGAYGQATLAVSLVPVFERLGGLQVAAAQSVATVVVLIVLTVLQMVLGELVPKSIALQYPTPTSRYTVVPLEWSIRAMRWLIAILNGSGVFLLKLIGMPASGHRHIHSASEIEYLIGESRDGGALKPTESARLRQALRLGLRTAGELMVPRPRMVGIEVDTPWDEVVEMMKRTPYSRLPVYEDSLDNIIGALHVRDVAKRLAHRSATSTSDAGSLRELVRDVMVVPETMTADRLLDRLRSEHKAMAIVADEYGGTAGLITVGDMLDELLGNTADEFKLGDAIPTTLADGRIRLSGTARLDLAAPFVGVLWEADSYTVSGLVMEKLGRLPRQGDLLTIDGVEIEVERMRGRAIESLLVRPVTQEVDDE